MKRFNLFDAAVVGFVVVLIPIAYGTYLLFRSPRPAVTSVERVDITKEERRVGGPNLVAKLKIRGSGLRPMLRAWIDDRPAIGFVFENPNSADLLVGATAPGAHDLVLYDGAQEVARAPKAVVIEPSAVPRTALVSIRFQAPAEVIALVKSGDRDTPLDQGAATVVDAAKDSATLRLAASKGERGWEYRGVDLKPGAEMTFTTGDYVLKGTILNVMLKDE
jgi:hypothetical protein